MRKCKNTNRQQTTFNDRKNIKTDINNEEKLAQKNKAINDKKHRLTQKC